nr:hypothetical protein CFP56_46268 [Quercus suber]
MSMAPLRSFSARFAVAPLRAKSEPRVFQVRVSFVKDVQKQEAWWERQHELAAENFVVLLKELTGIDINFM